MLWIFFQHAVSFGGFISVGIGSLFQNIYFRFRCPTSDYLTLLSCLVQVSFNHVRERERERETERDLITFKIPVFCIGIQEISCLPYHLLLLLQQTKFGVSNCGLIIFPVYALSLILR